MSGEITIAIRNGLKRSARKLVEKEEDLTKLEKQLDDAVIEENGKKRKLTEEEKETLLDEIKDRAEADLMAKPNEVGKLGGKVLNASQIRKLREELKLQKK